MRFACLSALVLGLPALALAQTEDKKPDAIESFVNALATNINIEGLETTFDPATGTATATGDVHIKYGDSELTANKAVYNTNTGDVQATGKVTLVKAGVTYQSEHMMYNVNTGKVSGDSVRSGMEHDQGLLLYSFNSMSTETQDVDRIDAQDTFFTTHDLANPNYRIKAKSMTIYPNDRVVMRNITVYAGNTPVFWFPYLSQPIDGELGYRFSPGYTSNWGAYLLNQYGVIHGDHTLAQYKLDLRSTRGVAFGADLFSLKQHRNGNDEWGKLQFYYAWDSAPLTNRANENRVDVPEGRYRINFQHRIYVTGPADRTWYLDFDINKISDQYMYEDFFFEEYRSNREPDNQISLVRSDPRYTATLMAKFQLNDFYRTDTRLPELAFDFTRQPIFNTGLFYQGNTSYGILEERRGDVEKARGKTFVDNITDPTNLTPGDTLNRFIGRPLGTAYTADDVTLAFDFLHSLTEDTGYNRFHTYHEVLYPKTFGGWLNFVPRVGVGFQQYSSIDRGAAKSYSFTDGTNTYDYNPKRGLPGSESRGLLQVGFDLSFKASKAWEDVQSAALGLDGIRHTVQPYINYSYLNADDINIPSIDRNVPTTRPRPLDIPFYTGIDSLRSWNIARVGVRNLLQTRRDYTSQSDDEERMFRSANESNSQTYTWAGLNTYVDLFFKDPEPGFDRSVSNLYNELFWRPVPWIQFGLDSQVPIGGDDSYTEANYHVTFMPSNRLEITLGHQYVSDHPFFQDSSLAYSRVYAKINENWAFSMNHRYEMDDHTLEYQSYQIHRDLSSWIATIGAFVRDNRGISDFGYIFSLTLKEFPQVTMPLDTDPNPGGRAGVR